MKMKPFKYIVAFISLLVFLLIGQAGGGDFFWCLAEDGQSALESFSGDGCGAAKPEHDSDCHNEESLVLSVQEEHCGTCLDLPASLHATTSNHLRAPQNVPAPLFLPAAVQTLPEPKSTQSLAVGLYSQPPLDFNKTLLFQRTVVLLI